MGDLRYCFEQERVLPMLKKMKEGLAVIDSDGISEQAIKDILENAYTKWIDIIKERNVSSCDYFVRLDLREIKKNQKIKKEFSEIRYNYQKNASSCDIRDGDVCCR